MNGITRRRLIYLGTLSAAAACLGISACNSSQSSGGAPVLNASNENENSSIEFLFDSVVQISGYCEQDILDDAIELCRYFEGILSRTIEGSDVSNINEAKGMPVEVADETAELIEAALHYCEVSGGLFDITIGSVSTLWDFDEGVKPDEDAIAEAIKHIDYTMISVDGNMVTLADPEAKIDLGGIAKGYIADKVAEQLVSAGVESALINLGGNVYALGTKPDGSEWSIGVQDPNDSRGNILATVDVDDQSVVTSGLYERQFEQDGINYYHILDPRTGYPVETDLVSTSIISDKSIDGDGFSTILFLKGVDAALALVEETPEIEAFLVDDAGFITMSSGCDAELLEG